ncbi:MAG: hypothetical protein RL685_525 [Pseudomonadota bacterium]|jgi:hypothetical protein
MAARISSWRERLQACFRWRQRLLHVLGVPSALGAVTAVASATALNPDVGLALGALAAGTGALIAGYYVVAGFDRSLEAQLAAEHQGKEQQLEQDELSQVLATAEPGIRAQLERCLQLYATTEAVFHDGVQDSVEGLLQSSLGDLAALKRRAVSMGKLHQRLSLVVQSSNADTLWHDIQRMDHQLARSEEGKVREALLAARESSAQALAQWQGARDKLAQVSSVLTLIENSLRQFKLGIELRKADAAMGSNATEHDVSELTARLMAAGQACDELVGGMSSAEAPRERRRAR